METWVFFWEGSGYGGWIRGRGNRVGTAVCWGSLGIFLWLIHSNLQGRDFALIWFVWLQTWATECEWWKKNYVMEKICFYGLLDEFVLFLTSRMWRGKMKKKNVLWKCYGKNITGSRFIMVCLNSMEKNTEKHICVRNKHNKLNKKMKWFMP